MVNIDFKDTNVQILILSGILILASMFLASEEEDYQDIVLFSPMTQQQVKTAAAKPSCKQALSSYCPLAGKSQSIMNGVSLVPELSAVKNECGNMFPVNEVCNNPIPNWAYLLGGIQAKPTPGM